MTAQIKDGGREATCDCDQPQVEAPTRRVTRGMGAAHTVPIPPDEEGSGSATTSAPQGGATTSVPPRIISVEEVCPPLVVRRKPGPRSRTRPGPSGMGELVRPDPAKSVSSSSSSGEREEKGARGGSRKRLSAAGRSRAKRRAGRQPSPEPPAESAGDSDDTLVSVDSLAAPQDRGNLEEDSPPEASAEEEDDPKDRTYGADPEAPKRGGKPRTTGEYVGLAAAKRRLAEAEERELALQAEREFLAEQATRRETRASYARGVMEGLGPVSADHPARKEATRAVLLREVEDAADSVVRVAATSKHLKGTYVKALKMAAEGMREAASRLGNLQATDEIRRLEAENAALKGEMAQMRQRLDAIECGFSGGVRGAEVVRPAPPPPPGTRTAAGGGGEEVAAGINLGYADFPPLPSKEAKRLRPPTRERGAAAPPPERREEETMEVTEGHSAAIASVPSKRTSKEPEPPKLPSTMEEMMGALTRSVLLQVGEMMDARMAVLAARLPPEERIRPPLRADKKGATPSAPVGAANRTAAPSRLGFLPPPGPTPPLVPIIRDSGQWEVVGVGRKKKGGKKGRAGRDESLPEEAPSPPGVKFPIAAASTTVAGKGAKGKGAKGPRPDPPNAPSAPRPRPAASTTATTAKRAPPTAGAGSRPRETAVSYAGAARLPAGAKRGAGTSAQPPRNGGLTKSQPRKAGAAGPSGQVKAQPGQLPASAGASKKRRRPPRRTAAVTLTLRPAEEGEREASMAEALGLATRTIDLGELGIEHLRPKRAATGGLILEVPGQESAPKAVALEERLSAALRGMAVKVARPVKNADIRVTGLDDAATPEAVAAAVAAAAGCGAEEVRVGRINESSRGLLRTVWATLPERAAHRVDKLGRVKVGWTLVRVTLLQPRPLQCHRCLGFGHTRQRCTSAEDRSGVCYRCGQQGHLAAGCTAPVKCLLCEGAGRAADHRMGGQACSGRRGPKATPSRRPAEKEAATRKGVTAKATKPKPKPPSPPQEAPSKAPKIKSGSKTAPKGEKEEAAKGLGVQAPPAPLPASSSTGDEVAAALPPPSPEEQDGRREDAMDTTQ